MYVQRVRGQWLTLQELVVVYSSTGVGYALFKPWLLWVSVRGQLLMLLLSSGDRGRAQAARQLL